MEKQILFRYAEKEDVSLILRFIKELWTVFRITGDTLTELAKE